MPRSRGGRSAPARASSAPSRPSAPAPPPRSMGNQQQSRPMSTTAAAQKAPPQAGAQQSPGLFGQMASTAAGVAVGSSIGHAIGGFFGGGSSSSEAQPQQQQGQDAYAQPMDNGLYSAQNQTASGAYGAAQDQPCMTDVKNFTRCMDENQGNMGICGWYMEQLKACQQAAGQY